MSIVDVLQAEAAVASRVEQILIAEKAIRDQEDRLRRLLNPGENELREDVRLTPQDPPAVALQPISLQEAIDIAIELRPRLFRPRRMWIAANLIPISPRTSCCRPFHSRAPWGWQALASNLGSSVNRNFSGDFYNYGAGLVLSYPLGNRSAWSTYSKRQMEGRNAQVSLAASDSRLSSACVKQCRVQTDFKRSRDDQVGAHHGGEAITGGTGTPEGRLPAPPASCWNFSAIWRPHRGTSCVPSLITTSRSRR